MMTALAALRNTILLVLEDAKQFLLELLEAQSQRVGKSLLLREHDLRDTISRPNQFGVGIQHHIPHRIYHLVHKGKLCT